MPTLSIIIPLYNKEKTISKTIHSVLNQTYQDFELIIVNDGSSDKSLEMVKLFKDRRIRIIDKINEGVSKARNAGVEYSNTNLLFFLDADDYIYPDCISKLMNLKEKYKDVDLWSANYEKQNNSGKHKELMSNFEGIIENPHKLIYLRKWHFRTGSFIITKSSFFHTGKYPLNICVGEDWLFLDEFCKSYQCAYTPTTVMCYIQDSRELSIKKIDYEKTAEWYLEFAKTNNWQKLSYSENIFKRFLISIIRKDAENTKKVFRKDYKYLPLGCISSVISLLFRL